jgi:DNA-binding transcriptional ArsR family regulator
MRSLAKDKLGLKADVFSALGHPLRLAIIEFLHDGEWSVGDIVASVGADMSRISKHLAVLKKAGIVAHRRQGLKMMYRIVMPCALDFSRTLEGALLRRLEEDRAFMVA